MCIILILYIPTHELNQNTRCHPMQSQNLEGDVSLHAQFVLNIVPNMPRMDSRHVDGGPAHLLVVWSTEHVCSKASSRELHEIILVKNVFTFNQEYQSINYLIIIMQSLRVKKLYIYIFNLFSVPTSFPLAIVRNSVVPTVIQLIYRSQKYCCFHLLRISFSKNLQSHNKTFLLPQSP